MLHLQIPPREPSGSALASTDQHFDSSPNCFLICSPSVPNSCPTSPSGRLHHHAYGAGGVFLRPGINALGARMAVGAASVSPAGLVSLPTVPTPIHLHQPPAITLEVESDSKNDLAPHNAVVYPSEDGNSLSATPGGGRPSPSLTSPSSLGGTPPDGLHVMPNGTLGPSNTSPVHLPPPGIPGEGGSPSKQVMPLYISS